MTIFFFKRHQNCSYLTMSYQYPKYIFHLIFPDFKPSLKLNNHLMHIWIHLLWSSRQLLWSSVSYSRLIWIKIRRVFNMQQFSRQMAGDARPKAPDHTAVSRVSWKTKAFQLKRPSSSKKTRTYERCACKGHLKATTTGITTRWPPRATVES